MRVLTHCLFQTETVCFSLNKHATNCECACANIALYFGVIVQCVYIRITGLFKMALFSSSSFFLCLLLLDFQLSYGGLILIINFSLS